MESNMGLWDKVCKTDPAHTKQVVIGRYEFTSIDAQWQIHNATEQWGKFGETWGVKDEKYEQIHLGDEKLPNYHYCIYTAKMYYPGGVTEIHSDIEIIHSSGKRDGDYNDDWTKKVATDALTKGLSKLGFNSDVFEGRFDDKYYVMELKREFNNVPPDKQAKKVTPDQVIELTDEITFKGGDAAKLLISVNKKFGTRYQSFAEMYQIHYDYILKIVQNKKG